jgi:hypothetical protein
MKSTVMGEFTFLMLTRRRMVKIVGPGENPERTAVWSAVGRRNLSRGA